LGLAYYRKGLYEEAIRTYKKFLEMKPDYRNAYLNLGLAYGGLKRWEEALLAFEEERKKHPDNYHIDVYLGFLYRDMGDWSKALIHFKKALDYPNLPHRDFIQEMILSIERAQQPNKRP
jgi:tetratricopeptide (TPR) repeat protein